jgi:Tol biopolymer transport system component
MIKGLGVVLLLLPVAGCGGGTPVATPTLNTPFQEQQPALSGDGRLLAFSSNRAGSQSLYLYDLEARRGLELPGLNRRGAIAESPSLSYTGRYLVYLSQMGGRPALVLYDRATNRAEFLAQGYPGQIRDPSISPEGRFVAFQGDRRGQWDIELIDRGAKTELDLAPGSPATSAPVQP